LIQTQGIRLLFFGREITSLPPSRNRGLSLTRFTLPSPRKTAPHSWVISIAEFRRGNRFKGMNMMNLLAMIGTQEMIVIFLIVLLLFGAKKIPELARGVGKGLGEFKKAKTEFEKEIREGEIDAAKDWDDTGKPKSNPRD
jgi:sec-independent protein translocase protein TatA